MDRRLLELERDRYRVGTAPIEVVVVGSGYCGVELAATLAERLGNRGNVKVVDTTPDIVASAPAGNREAALKVLLFHDITVQSCDMPSCRTFSPSCVHKYLYLLLRADECFC